MSRMMFARLVLALLACATSSSASAREYTSGHLLIGHPWSRPVPAGIPTGVAYLSITNNGSGEELLLGARTPAAESVHMHQTTVTGGIARMRPAGPVSIAPGATLRIAPGGIHLMLIGLKAPLTAGDQIPLTLVFRNAGEVEVAIRVESRDPAAE